MRYLVGSALFHGLIILFLGMSLPVEKKVNPDLTEFRFVPSDQDNIPNPRFNPQPRNNQSAGKRSGFSLKDFTTLSRNETRPDSGQNLESDSVDSIKVAKSGTRPEIINGVSYIPELSDEEEASLGSKRLKYFSYFERIKAQVYPIWSPQVREVIRQEISRRKKENYRSEVTRCFIVLNQNGDLTEIDIIRNSQISALDRIATESFRAAGRFQHPPAGIIDEDGLIRLRWDFIVEY